MSTDNSTCDLKVQEALVATGFTMQFPDGKIVPLASMECPSEDIKKMLEQVVSSSDSDSQGASKGGFRWNPVCHAKVMRWFSFMGVAKGMGYVAGAGITYAAIREIANRAGITEEMSEQEMRDKTAMFLATLTGAAVVGAAAGVISTFTPINYRAYVELYEICHKAAMYNFGGRKARKSRKARKARKSRKSRRY
jgi:hypothetical protein